MYIFKSRIRRRTPDVILNFDTGTELTQVLEAVQSVTASTPDEIEQSLPTHLHPLLTLPADLLLHQLLDDPDGFPIPWAAYPPLVSYLL